MERRTEPLGCHISFVSQQRRKTKAFFRLLFSNKVLFQMRSVFSDLPWRYLNFSYVFKLPLKLHWQMNTQRRYSRIDASSSYTCLMTLQWRRVSTGCEVFYKKNYEITYGFSKTFRNIYEGVKLSGVAGLQRATLLRINPSIDMMQGFQRSILKILPHFFNLFNKCRQLLIFK